MNSECDCGNLDNHAYCPVHGYPPYGGQAKPDLSQLTMGELFQTTATILGKQEIADVDMADLYAIHDEMTRREHSPDVVKVTVELHGMEAFDEPVRTVLVPAVDWEGAENVRQKLNLVWIYGQNDMQPQRQRSLVVGDVILLDGKRYVVAPFGFGELDEDAYAELLKTKDPRMVHFAIRT
jgi:hypothetical protein